jgi:hypothetical protein
MSVVLRTDLTRQPAWERVAPLKRKADAEPAAAVASPCWYRPGVTMTVNDLKS